MEHLRYVARAHGADPVEVALETAQILAHAAGDPLGLVVSARRLVEHHPTSAPLWWLCARVLTSIDPAVAAGEAGALLRTDATGAHLADAFEDETTVCTVGWSGHALDAFVRRGDVSVLVVDSLGDGQAALTALDRNDVAAELVAPEGAGAAAVAADLVVIPALACGREEVLAPGGALALAATAYCFDTPVWVVTGRGTRLPDQLWAAMRDDARPRSEAWTNGLDLVPWTLVTHVVGPDGVSARDEADLSPECENAPELLRRSAL